MFDNKEHNRFLNTTGSAISGATGGAVVGSFFGPVGSVIGASIGGFVGGYASYNSGNHHKNQNPTEQKHFISTKSAQ